MLKNIMNTVSNMGNSINKPVFLKEEDATAELLRELSKLQSDITDEKMSENIEREIRLIKYGDEGEKNVIYELKNSFIPMYIIHDLTIQYDDYKAQMDFVLITKKFICILETKKLNGNIAINSDGDFIRSFKNSSGKTIKKEGMYSPISQNQRHKRILEDFFKQNKIAKNVPIYTLVTIANPKSIIDFKYVKKEVRNEIVKYDQLTSRLNTMLKDSTDTLLSFPAMEKIGRAILEQHIELENSFLKKYIEIKADDLEKEKNVAEAVGDEPQAKVRNKVTSNYTEPKPKAESRTYKAKAESSTYKAKAESSTYKAIAENTDNEKITNELKKYRLEQSRIEKVKAYFIFSNKHMEELIEKMPRTKADLKACSGFGDVKVEKYGDAILKILQG